MKTYKDIWKNGFNYQFNNNFGETFHGLLNYDNDKRIGYFYQSKNKGFWLDFNKR